jgi:hypothetical protein
MVNYQEIYDQNKQKYNDLCVNQLGGMSDTVGLLIFSALFVLIVIIVYWAIHFDKKISFPQIFYDTIANFLPNINEANIKKI